MSERRARPRLDKEWDMGLSVPSEGHRDDSASAFDLTTAGFAVKTRLKLEAGRRFEFSVQIPGGKRFSGAGKVVWVYQLRGRTIAGTRIVKISKRDALRLRLAVDPHGRRYLRIAGNAFAGLVCGTAVLAVESLLRAERPPPQGPAELYPYFGAAGMALSVVLFLYFRLGGDRRV